MEHESERRLMDQSEVLSVLGLTLESLITLINTGQLLPMRICGQTKYDRRDVAALIDTYRQVAKRKHNHAE